MSAEILHDRAAQFLMAADGVGFDDARARLNRAALMISADADLNAPHQAIILAAVRCAMRMFQGGVYIDPSVGGRLAIGQGPGMPLRRALQSLGALPINPPDHAARLHVGPGGGNAATLHAWADGWSAVISPEPPTETPAAANVIAGVATGGLAVSELFRRVVLDDVRACRRMTSLDVAGDSAGLPVDITVLPKELWLIGLGNLGQATLFVLSLLPWNDAAETHLLLNDGDVAGPENLSVQILTEHGWIGRRKARAAAEWLETRGFATTIVERRFDKSTRLSDNDPRVAIVGVDNLPTRRLVAAAGFDLVIDAGLGATGAEAFDIRIHAFPGSQDGDTVWPENAAQDPVASTPALDELVRQKRLDICGALKIANASVGVPCTALVAAALQIAQLCRALQTGRCADKIDVSLVDPRRIHWRSMPAAPARQPRSVPALL